MSQLWQNWIKKRFHCDGQKHFSQKDVFVFIYKQGFLYLVLILITFIAGVNYANNLILGFCFLITAILCVSFYLTFKQLHGLSLTIITDEVSQVGQEQSLKLYFSQPDNQTRYLWIKSEQNLKQLIISEKQQEFRISFSAKTRGRFDYPKIQIYSVYPFGLVRAWSYLYLQKFTWIAPETKTQLNENTHNKLSFDPDLDEFRELRNFKLGDSLHAVSWKQVARGQGMYVKVFEQYQDQRSVEIDYAQMPSTSHEEKLSLMMGLIEQCEQQHCAYRVKTPSSILAIGIGEQHFRDARIILAQA